MTQDHAPQAGLLPRRGGRGVRAARAGTGYPAEPALPAPQSARLPDLGRGLRWGSILLGALGGLVGLLASLWLYDYVLALIARDDWIGWVAVGLLGLVALRAADDHPARGRRPAAARPSRQDPP